MTILHLLPQVDHNKIWFLPWFLSQVQLMTLITMAKRPMSRRFRFMKRVRQSQRSKAQCLTFPRGYRASGPVGMVPGSGVCVTILNICNREHWSKLICRQGPHPHASLTTAQSLRLGPAQKLGSPLGSHTWDYPAQGPLFQQHVELRPFLTSKRNQKKKIAWMYVYHVYTDFS